MDFAETQVQEIEALEAIYPNELEVTNREYPGISLKITLSSNTDPVAEPTPFDFRTTLFLSLPADYPDVVPEISLKGIDDIFEESRIQEVVSNLQSVAEENLSMPMIFTIVSSLQDNIGKLLEERLSEKEREVERKKQEEEALARRKIEGTEVTVESFNNWLKKFIAEMNALKEKEVAAREAAAAKKLTGKQLFLRDATLNLSDVKIIQESDDIEFDESLFDEDLDALDLDDKQ